MFENKETLVTNIDNQEVVLSIFGEHAAKKTIFNIEKEKAFANGEAPVQIIEGCFYEYEISEDFCLEPSKIVSQSKLNQSSGRISPNIYVGTLTIGVLEIKNRKKCGEFKLEVQSIKTSYRKDYRQMLEEITEHCTDLLLQHSSLVSQFFEVDFEADANTLYQRFAFIKSILDSDEFNDSIKKILSSPVKEWIESETSKDIRGVRRLSSSGIKQIIYATNRIDFPQNHPLKSTLDSIPSKISITYKSETVNTPENRFVKHALKSFLTFISEFRIKLKENDRLIQEAILLEDKLEQYLNHSIFKSISRPTTLPLNSPVLQRKEGYREILRVWLMFDLAAKLVWHGGDDVYSGGKRDVAVLYEYWLFFKLLEVMKEVFSIDYDSIENLIEKTNDGLGLKLKEGKHLPIKGVYISDSRKLNIEFSYNKTFSGNQKYPNGGSWTRNLRPDYTLSIWPYGIEQNEAEEEELIVHIHFDAKYKIENLNSIYGSNDNLKEEKEEQKTGTYKRADILKMHTYRDAIRRTAGAYVLYPGTEYNVKEGFHEILPGLGAFPVRPSKYDNGISELKAFILKVIDHFVNRASQREKFAYRTYDVFKEKPQKENEVNEALPEPYGDNRDLIPDDTFVLVGYIKNDIQLDWLKETNHYNIRYGEKYPLTPEEIGAKYLLLYSNDDEIEPHFYKLSKDGPKFYSGKELQEDLGYKTKPSQPMYLVYQLDSEIENEFKNKEWKVPQNPNHNERPFAISLTELLNS